LYFGYRRSWFGWSDKATLELFGYSAFDVLVITKCVIFEDFGSEGRVANSIMIDALARRQSDVRNEVQSV